MLKANEDLLRWCIDRLRGLGLGLLRSCALASIEILRIKSLADTFITVLKSPQNEQIRILHRI
jgi:hypothetical protein